MDETQMRILGGQSSRKNMTPEKASKLAEKAGKAGWKGHKKTGQCSCAHCAAKNT